MPGGAFSHASSLGRRRPYGERVGLRVEDVLVWTEQLHVIREEQIQVLQRLTQKKTLHFVAGSRVGRVPDIADRCVASVRHLQIDSFQSEAVCLTERSTKVK